MRNKCYFRILLGITLYIWVNIVFAAGFNATVESNNIPFGNIVRLKLLLTDAKPIEHIDISTLARDFTIHNQQQFSSYRNVNGEVQVETGWNIVLMPKKPGQLIIPAISLETDKGRFSTQEITIKISAAKSGAKKSDSLGISLVSIVSKAKAYINEPIIYTLKVISYKNIANVVLDDIKSNDAIIEKIGEPKQYNQVHGGVNAHIIEIRYAVTALKAGKVTILPALLRGELQVPSAQAQRPQRFGLFNDLFLDNLVELKPFSLQSDKITIDIIEPVAKNNWLPLRNLTLTEKWDGIANVKAGDTITRKIIMTAKGAFSKQIPTANNFMQVENLKTYANKPTFDDSYNEQDNTIIGIREEEYSLVPQQEGNFMLPEVKIQWWNLNNKKLETATLPAKIIKVAAANAAATPNVTIDYSKENAVQQLDSTIKTNQSNNAIIYVLLGSLIGMLVSIGAVIFYLSKKKVIIFSNTKPRSTPVSSKQQAVATVLDLRDSILKHAIKTWGSAPGLTLNRLGDTLANNNYTYDIQKYDQLCSNINAALYAKKDNTVLDVLLVQWDEFKKSVHKRKVTLDEPIQQDYSSINPT